MWPHRSGLARLYPNESIELCRFATWMVLARKHSSLAVADALVVCRSKAGRTHFLNLPADLSVDRLIEWLR